MRICWDESSIVKTGFSVWVTEKRFCGLVFTGFITCHVCKLRKEKCLFGIYLTVKRIFSHFQGDLRSYTIFTASSHDSGNGEECTTLLEFQHRSYVPDNLLLYFIFCTLLLIVPYCLNFLYLNVIFLRKPPFLIIHLKFKISRSNYHIKIYISFYVQSYQEDFRVHFHRKIEVQTTRPRECFGWARARFRSHGVRARTTQYNVRIKIST